MNSGKSIFKVLGVVLVLSLTVPTVYAQTGRHRPPKIWSPPDKSFSIEVPTDLKEFDGFGEEICPDAVKNYGAEKNGLTFVVYVLKYKHFSTESTENKFGGLFFTIGGDDDHEFVEKNGKIDGFPSQEIVYRKQPKKGLFIDAGNTVIVLGIAAKDRKDLQSSEANLFFSSFRLNRKSRKISK